MKKQLLLLTVVGGALAVAAPQVQAQAPLPSIYFNPDTATNPDGSAVNPNAANKTANVITVNGNIPEFIQFTDIDNNLEFGNMGGPTNTGKDGFVQSQAYGANTADGTFVYPSYIVPEGGGLNQNADGKAAVQFKSNAYIVLVSKADPMRNVGPDGQTGTADDIVLTTGFIRRYRGNAAFYNATTIGPGTTGLSSQNFNPSNDTPNSTYYYNQSPIMNNADGGNETFKDATVDGTLIDQIIYKPGSPYPAPYDSNGYWMAARVARHGLNDYRGDYVGKVNLTYYKF